MDKELKKNADRFTGFADTYENARPAVPKYPINIIVKYLGEKPGNVVDLGCGTGLSTTVWEDYCNKVVGVEPSLDMINLAKQKETDKIIFINEYASNTGLETDFADAVVCSQSFHWMEPVTTLKEVNRILKKDGIFATIDCDWPPLSVWKADKAYSKLYDKVKIIEKEVPEIKDSFNRYSKEEHLDNIRKSGYFTYSREILFSNTEKCTAERYINLILSQGSTQVILKKQPHLLSEDIQKFKNIIYKIFEDSEFDIEFYYRMRIGVK